MTSGKALDDLVKSAEGSIKEKTLPPVDSWNPPLSGDIDIRIARNGDWFYQDSRFERPALVKLFASILRRDDDGDHYLVTPVEKWRISVEDAPFLATSVERSEERGEQVLYLSTQIGDRVRVDQHHPLRVETDPATGEPSPYVLVRGRLEALIGRSLFYELVEMAQERKQGEHTRLVLESAGQEFSLGQY